MLGLYAARAHAADPGEVERLREENARLAERVRALESERDRLLERCPPPVAAAVERAASEKVSVTVDEKRGGALATTDRSRLERTSGGQSKHWLTVRAHRGSSGVERASLVIDADASGGAYRHVRSVQLSIDGRTEDLAVENYEAAQIATAARMPRPVSMAESVVVAVPPDTLARLADAHDVWGSLGSTRFRLTPEQLLAVRALVHRLEGR
jgi:hypothetical protein